MQLGCSGGCGGCAHKCGYQRAPYEAEESATMYSLGFDRAGHVTPSGVAVGGLKIGLGGEEPSEFAGFTKPAATFLLPLAVAAWWFLGRK